MLVDKCEPANGNKMAEMKLKPQLALKKKSNKVQSIDNAAVETIQIYRDGLDTLERERYCDKIRVVKGQDPYEIETWSRDNNLLPNITYMDIINYLVFKPSPYTANELRCYKGLDAYNQFVNGWVRDTGYCIVNERCIMTAKVLHSQRLNEKPLRPWVIAEKDGQVITGHCTCMAGLGEACTHVASLLFYVEAAVKIRNGKTCTEVPAYWKLPAVFQHASYVELKKLDFSSAASLKKRFDTSLDQECSEPVTPKQTKKTVPPPDQAHLQRFLQALNNSNSKPAVLSLMPEFNDKYVPKALQCDLPDVLSELYDENCQKLNDSDLITKCESIEVNVTKEQSDHVEIVTRKQSHNRLWYRFRSGRVTASRMKAICRTNPTKPAASLIKSVCYPEAAKFSTKATKWGCSHENIARDTFLESMAQKHDNVRMQTSGFVISTDQPHIGASPDAVMTCDCCGTSPVEIKCPFCKRDYRLDEVSDKQFCLQKDENDKLKLVKGHTYYYQLQTQIGVLECESGFFVVWTEKDLHVEQVMFDRELWREICEKSLHIFRTALLPELVGKLFSRKVTGNTVHVDVTSNTTHVDVNSNTTHVDVTGNISNVDVTANTSHVDVTSNTSHVDVTSNTAYVDSTIESSSAEFTAERLWCYCKDVEYGDMVECENYDCEHVWFHFACIGIKSAPKGHWFCPDCRKICKGKK